MPSTDLCGGVSSEFLAFDSDSNVFLVGYPQTCFKTICIFMFDTLKRGSYKRASRGKRRRRKRPERDGAAGREPGLEGAEELKVSTTWSRVLCIVC